MQFGFEYETLMYNKNKLCDDDDDCIFGFVSEEDKHLISTYMNSKGLTSQVLGSFPENINYDRWYITYDLSVNMYCYTMKKIYSRLFVEPAIDKDTSNMKFIKGVEIISPVFSFSNDYHWNPIDRFMEIFNPSIRCNNLISYHNEKTSTHIHYSIPGLDFNGMFNIYLAWWYFEPILMELVPFWRRGNKFCTMIRDSIYSKFINLGSLEVDKVFCYTHDIIKAAMGLKPSTDNNTEGMKKLIALFQYDAVGGTERMKTLNMANMITPRKENKNEPIGTIEVRLKHGSVDAEELKMYVKLYATFFQMTKDKPEFFDRSCSRASQYTNRQVLVSTQVDSSVHLYILNEFIGDNEMMLYFYKRWKVLKTNNVEALFFDPITGGGSRQKPSTKKKTNRKIRVNGRERVVYLGPRGGQYVKLNGTFVSMSQLNI